MGARFADSICYPKISAASSSKTLPFHGSPTQAYQSLFGSVATGKDRKQFESQGNLFEYLGEDVKALRRNLARCLVQQVTSASAMRCHDSLSRRTSDVTAALPA